MKKGWIFIVIYENEYFTLPPKAAPIDIGKNDSQMTYSDPGADTDSYRWA